MKNVAVIPVTANNEEELELPIGEINGTTLLETVYQQTKQVSMINLSLVTSNSKVIGRYCASKGIPFFPSSQDCPTGTHRCAEVVSRFDPAKAETVGNIICWPITYPNVQPYDVDDMIAKYNGDGISTLVKDIYENEREEFNSDSTKVKARVAGSGRWNTSPGNRCWDFSRCPLPLAMWHIGIYVYAVKELIKAAMVAPTKLSIEEDLEQLAWMQYGIRQSASLLRRTGNEKFVAVRSTNQLQEMFEETVL